MPARKTSVRRGRSKSSTRKTSKRSKSSTRNASKRSKSSTRKASKRSKSSTRKTSKRSKASLKKNGKFTWIGFVRNYQKEHKIEDYGSALHQAAKPWKAYKKQHGM